MTTCTMSFSLDLDADRRLLDWLENAPPGKRSDIIRSALYARMDEDDLTLRDLYDLISQMKEELEALG